MKMKHFPRLLLLPAISALVSCDAFAPTHNHRTRSQALLSTAIKAKATTVDDFLNTLDAPPGKINARSETRTNLLNNVIAEGGLPNPGSKESFMGVAPGMWRVCYAPHMTKMAGLFQGEFSVEVSAINFLS